MDNVVLGLSVSIAIIVVLLLSCWDSKPKKKACNKEGASQYDMSRNGESQLFAEVSQPELSKWGSGVKNKEFENRYGDLTNLVSAGDYNAVAQYMSLDPEVYESHERYSSDMSRMSSGASMLPVRDDPNDINPWVGLRRPKYQESYVQPNARQEPSEMVDQMPTSNTYVLG